MLPALFISEEVPDESLASHSTFDWIESGHEELQAHSGNTDANRSNHQHEYASEPPLYHENFICRAFCEGQWNSGSEDVEIPLGAGRVAAANILREGANTTLQMAPDGCPQLIHDVFGANYRSACIIAYCESSYHPDVIGDSGASLGIFQIQPRWHQARADALFGPGANLLDPEVNVRTAHVISSGGTDWSQWSCRVRL